MLALFTLSEALNRDKFGIPSSGRGSNQVQLDVIGRVVDFSLAPSDGERVGVRGSSVAIPVLPLSSRDYGLTMR